MLLHESRLPELLNLHYTLNDRPLFGWLAKTLIVSGYRVHPRRDDGYFEAFVQLATVDVDVAILAAGGQLLYHVADWSLFEIYRWQPGPTLEIVTWRPCPGGGFL